MKKVMRDKIDVSSKYVKWFSELGIKDIKTVGGKGANLGEMTKAGFPVPPGFCITVKAYEDFLEHTGIKEKIYEILSKLDVNDTEKLEDVAVQIKEMIINEEIPEDMAEEILENYESLNIDKETFEKASADALAILKKGYEPVFVAVRSSATAEDSGEASFAGQNETFLNVKGKTNLTEAIKKCWASLFTARSIYYRIKKGFKHEEVLISVIVQVMVDSEKSGVIFSRDPVESQDNVVIEAVFGLGEGIVSGQINPDHYLVSRDLKIIAKGRSDKKIAIVRNSSGHNETVKLNPEKSKSQVLTDYEIKRYADFSLRLEEHYGKPQDTEFAIDSGNLYIVQTRPITTLNMNKDKVKREITGKEILKGISASPGIVSGKVKLVNSLADLAKVKKGDILVTKMTNPDMVVAMQRSAGIVTDEGGMTSHAAIVSREMGIPAVVGTEHATEILKEEQEITVDGFAGRVIDGREENVKVEIKPVVNTKTSLKIIVDLPDYAERAAETGIKKVGLTRIEGIIAESGKHPFYFLKSGKIKDYENVVFRGVSKIAEYFDEVWVRTSDIRSDEFRNLEGAKKDVEVNPMLGMHGIRFSLKYPEIMKAELLALKRISDKGKRIGLILPQVIDVSEVKQTKEILKEIDFLDARVGVMIETPAAVQIIDELCEEGIEFISFGTNDLTQFTLAIDRGNEELQSLYNEMHPAMQKQIAHVISVCKKNSVETSICGQAGSNKKMVEFLVKQGIDSISVNADVAGEISEFIADMENKGLRGSFDDVKEIEKVEIEQKKESPQEQTETVEEFPDTDIAIDIFSEAGEGAKVENIDNLEHVEERIEEKKKEVEQEKKEHQSETVVEIEEKKKEDDIILDIF